jgi:predicted AlkP superfamily pyrophosphatase or phosphodiesterase
MRSLFASLALGVVCLPGSQAFADEQRQDPPRLVVAISVDQFSADLFAQYRQHFAYGLKRLTQGAVFPAGFQSHAATETCPGHSTLLTGARPARTGIIANMWFDPGIARADKRVYCSEDVTNPASTSGDPVVSARMLKVPTLGDRLKAANPASRNVAVSAKDRAVVMMGGHAIDAGYWWKGGSFVTFAGRELLPSAEAENADVTRLLASGGRAYSVPAWCAARDRAVQVGKRSVGTGRFAMDKGSETEFRLSPRLDNATADLALRLVDEMNLGKGAATDVLSVSLSANDYIGHTFGTEGVEMCIQMAELDKTIGRILARLDERGIDYVVALSADHGGFDAPERLVQQALPGAMRADKSLGAEALAAAVTARTRITTTGPMLYSDGPFGDIYITDALGSADKQRVATVLADILRIHPQVAAVFTGQELAETIMPSGSPQDWTLKERARASFDAERSGDVVMLLDRNVVPIPDPNRGAVATHGSPWDYDRRVPILFWRKGMAGFEQPSPVETVDIAPTLAAVLGFRVPEGAFDGRCLDIDGGPGNSCGGDS